MKEVAFHRNYLSVTVEEEELKEAENIISNYENHIYFPEQSIIANSLSRYNKIKENTYNQKTLK